MSTANSRVPGWTADASVYRASKRYLPANSASAIVGETVLAQMRVGGGRVGGMGPVVQGGFWSCAICTAACSLLLGPEAVVECLIACKDSGACDD